MRTYAMGLVEHGTPHDDILVSASSYKVIYESRNRAR